MNVNNTLGKFHGDICLIFYPIPPLCLRLNTDNSQMSTLDFSFLTTVGLQFPTTASYVPSCTYWARLQKQLFTELQHQIAQDTVTVGETATEQL